MVVMTGAFFLNLLCSIANCDPKRSLPEIRSGNDIESGISSGANGFKREVVAEPIVQTNSGVVEGYPMRTTEGRKIFAFEGIPYGQAPVDELRFKPPRPISPWPGVLKAFKPMPECLQLSPPKLLRIVGIENCLFLNVYSPNIKKDARLPVVFLIHGGSFYFGAGSDYGPAYLLNKNILLVSISYRLGVLGFLSSGDKVSPGNYGLKDQALALKWTYENIANFGGDPTRITVIGQSSGAASSHHLLLSKKTRPYINNGFSMSGSSFNHFALKSKAEAQRLTEKLATVVNCPIRNTQRMITCLRSRNPVSLVSAQLKMLEFLPFPVTHFSPVIEPPNPDAIIPQSPEEVYYEAQLLDEGGDSTEVNHTRVARNSLAKPWIFGMTSDEGYLGLLFLQSFLQEASLRRNWADFAPIFLDYKYFAGENVTLITDMLSKFYFKNKNMLSIPKERIAQLFGDRFFLYGFIRAIQMHSRIAPTYAYIFDYKGKYNSANLIGVNSDDWGVGHTEDLFYLLNSTFWYEGFKKSDKDEYRMSQFMTTVLSNFASNDKPTPPSLNIWNEVDPDKELEYLNIGKKIKMMKLHQNELGDRSDFWSGLRYDKMLKNALNLQ